MVDGYSENRKKYFATPEGKKEPLYRTFHWPLYKAIGYTDEELQRPKILIVNSFSETTPGHSYLKEIGHAAALGVYTAGGTSFEFDVPGVCDGMINDWTDFKYDLLKRDSIAAVIDSCVRCAGWIDGIVFICGCDKIVPGMLLAARRLNLPSLFVVSGPMYVGKYEGSQVMLGANLSCLQRYIKGELSSEEYREQSVKIEEAIGCSAGTCPEMTTGVSMHFIVEALGMMLPYCATTPMMSSAKIRLAKYSGMQVVKLAQDGIRPSDIITEKAVENAISVTMATGGGTNAILHIQALAYEGGLKISLLDNWDAISKKCPWTCAVAPGGPYSVVDFHEAGGVPAALKNMSELIHADCLTVTGKTVGENIQNAVIRNRDVIRPLIKPLYPEGSITILKGNLAPRGAVVRHAVIADRSLLKYEWTARVFDSADAAMENIWQGNIRPGEAVVARYEGPRGGPGLTEVIGIITAMNQMDLGKVCLITDGRFSGLTKKYLAIGHVCPEAQERGPIAVVEDGDKIMVDIPNGIIELKITDAEMARRLAKLPKHKLEPGKTSLAVYHRLALQADWGGCWDLEINDPD
jgi:dihydroxy-acid dehydratase